MQFATRRHRLAHGFTLVEIMVVVLIIGLGIAVVSFAIGGKQPLRLRNEARQLANQLEMVAAEAALGGEAWGLQFYREIDRNTGTVYIAWRWLHFREPNSAPVAAIKSTSDKPSRENNLGWQTEAPRDLDAGGKFSEDAEVVLEIEGKEVPIALLDDEKMRSNKKAGKRGNAEKSGLQPDIWLAPGGEMTPFALRLNFVGESDGPVVRGDALGRIDVDAQNVPR